MAVLCCLTVLHFSPFSSNSQLDLSHLLTRTWLSPQCKACPIDFPVKLLLPWPQTYCPPAVPQKPHGICRPSPSLPQFSCPLPTWLPSRRQEQLKPFSFQHPTFNLLSRLLIPIPAAVVSVLTSCQALPGRFVSGPVVTKIPTQYLVLNLLYFTVS